MLVIPAIDLKDGKVVRLLKGSYQDVTVYSGVPQETAKEWQSQGARRLHIVDLDGALTGKPQNINTLQRILKEISIPVQFGGGLRSHEDISKILNLGVKWAILGTKACEDFDFVQQASKEFGGKIIVSIDVKSKKVAACGWTKISQAEDVDLINQMQKIGIKSFIYTDISRDGTLSGFNISGIEEVLEKTKASIFYSGGISSTADIKGLKGLEEKGLAGIIIGKALYENKLNLGQVKSILEEKP